MKGWKDIFLSAAGKEVMIKSVVQSIPTYVMSVFELPSHICAELHRCMAAFWWGDTDSRKKLHWLAWEKMCVPKEQGGLGFRDMKLFNQALLAKQGWRLLSQPDSLVAQTLKAKYFPRSSFLQAEVKANDSYVWRSLMKGKELLSKGIRYQVGTGEGISVWNDPWIPKPYTFKPVMGEIEGLEGLTVADLIDLVSQDWMEVWLHELFVENEVEIIKRIPLSVRRPIDKLVWHFDKHGQYFVRSGYHTARHIQSDSNRGSAPADSLNCNIWKKIWKVNVLPKVKSFVWKLVKNIVPTRMTICSRFPIPEQNCVLCRGMEETSMHLFKDCDVTACVWLCSTLGLRPRNHNASNMQEWIEAMLEMLSSDQTEEFFMILWAVWLARNDVFWNGRVLEPRRVVDSALKLLSEYRQVRPTVVKGRRSRETVKWNVPPRGRLKLNFDGAFKEDGRGGAEMIVRDEGGRVVAAWSADLSSLNSPLHAETWACREGLSVAIRRGWRNLMVESDYALLVNALNYSSRDYLEVGSLLEDCRELLKCFDCVDVRHIYREANNAAYRMAHFASIGTVVPLQLGEVPSFLLDVIFADGCTADGVAQGQVIMPPLDSAEF